MAVLAKLAIFLQLLLTLYLLSDRLALALLTNPKLRGYETPSFASCCCKRLTTARRRSPTPVYSFVFVLTSATSGLEVTAGRRIAVGNERSWESGDTQLANHALYKSHWIGPSPQLGQLCHLCDKGLLVKTVQP